MCIFQNSLIRLAKICVLSVKKIEILEMLMNYTSLTDLEAREPLNDNAVVSRILLQDEGEIIIIEGKHVAVDKNNNRVKKSFAYNTPIWMVGEYA